MLVVWNGPNSISKTINSGGIIQHLNIPPNTSNNLLSHLQKKEHKLEAEGLAILKAIHRYEHPHLMGGLADKTLGPQEYFLIVNPPSNLERLACSS